MAVQTANGEYRYDLRLGDQTLDQWVQGAHQHNCQQHGWDYRPLRPGAFGYDNLVISLGYALATKSRDRTILAEAIHRGWVVNYVYWRDHRPWEREGYFKPFKPLADPRRDECAQTPFSDLPEEEKEKDLLLADFLLTQL